GSGTGGGTGSGTGGSTGSGTGGSTGSGTGGSTGSGTGGSTGSGTGGSTGSGTGGSTGSGTGGSTGSGTGTGGSTGSGIGQAPLAPRSRKTTVRYTPSGPASSVAIAGEFNGWSPTAAPLAQSAGNTWEAAIQVPTGEWGYKVVVDGRQWLLDSGNPYEKYVSGVLNSSLRVEDPEAPLLVLEQFQVDGQSGAIDAVVAYQDGAEGRGPAASSLSVVLESSSPQLNGTSLQLQSWDPVSRRWAIYLTGLPQGKHVIRVNAGEQGGKTARELYLPAWIEPQRFHWKDGILYFVMTDRFADGDQSNNGMVSGVPYESNFQGGDYQGLLDKLRAGYFQNLNVNVLWLAAPNDAPDTPGLGSDGRLYSGYHGYWPASMTSVEQRYGTMQTLRAVVDEAHKRGMRVILDYVANHVHTDNPLWVQHQGADWFNRLCVCGVTCSWQGQDGIRCWFTDYLPDFNYYNHAVMQEIARNAVYWLKETSADGFRLDAVKHMPHIFGRYLRATVEEELGQTGVRTYFVGETFTGRWGGAEAEIKSYVSPSELDGQFDFPLYWEIVSTMARREQGMRPLERVLRQTATYYGPDAVMSSFLGNHDVPRFISHASANSWDLWGTGSKDAAWLNPPGSPQDSAPYERLNVAFSLLMTGPHAPLVYYGDEVALPGAGDPDNRRLMKFSNLTQSESAVKGHTALLAGIRKSSRALRHGSYETLWVDDQLLVFARQDGTNPAWVVALNIGDAGRNGKTIPLPAGLNLGNGTTLSELVHGGNATVSTGNLTFSVGPRDTLVFKP
ncbi:alpha-amylase family glycosyl hydrolase, partial [Planctomycetota bacterium]